MTAVRVPIQDKTWQEMKSAFSLRTVLGSAMPCDAQRRLEVLRFDTAIERRPVAQGELAREHAAGDAAAGADVDESAGDDRTGHAAEHDDVTGENVAGHRRRHCHGDRLAVAPHRPVDAALDDEIVCALDLAAHHDAVADQPHADIVAHGADVSRRLRR